MSNGGGWPLKRPPRRTSRLYPPLSGGRRANGQARLFAVATAALAFLVAGFSSSSSLAATLKRHRPPPPLQPVPASVLEGDMARGQTVDRSYLMIKGALAIPASARSPITLSDVTLAGGLRLPSELRAPLTLNHVTISGPVSADSVTFDAVLDLQDCSLAQGGTFTGATFRAPAVFTRLNSDGPLHFALASFDGLALFPDSKFNGHAYFTGAQFRGVARFTGAAIAQGNFNSAWFGDIAEFSGTRFVFKALFSSVEFRSIADFTGAQFFDGASFRASRFSAFGDFSRATFAAPGRPRSSFSAARFDEGANFLDAYFGSQVSFDRIDSSGDLQFDGSTFKGGAVFAASRLLGNTTFNGSEIDGPLNFGDGFINAIDLDGATIQDRPGLVTLPNNRGAVSNNRASAPKVRVASYLGQLRFDPSDLNAIALSAKDRESALALMQSAALRGGDERAANQAQYDRWTLLRHGRGFAPRVGDWIFMWGVAGYLVRPWHQAITILLLLMLATYVRRNQIALITLRRRIARLPILRRANQRFIERRVNRRRIERRAQTYALRRTARPSAVTHGKQSSAAAGSYLRSLVASFTAIWRFKLSGRPAEVVEGLAYKFVFLILLLSLANVWPLGHDLLKGVLPF
jgi:hypothetical protein